MREVLARIQRLLEAKVRHEKRMSDLLMGMGFINKQQLQEALKIAGERNMRVGEALYSMGVLDMDRLCFMRIALAT